MHFSAYIINTSSYIVRSIFTLVFITTFSLRFYGMGKRKMNVKEMCNSTFLPVIEDYNKLRMWEILFPIPDRRYWLQKNFMPCFIILSVFIIHLGNCEENYYNDKHEFYYIRTSNELILLLQTFL